MKARFDVLVLIAASALILALLAAIADRSFTRPLPARPAPVAAPPPALPTLTPQATATGGWWDGVSMTPAALPALPRVAALALGSLGNSTMSGGQPVAFTVVACPQAAVKITKIVTARPPWWNVYGAAAIPSLEYWKAELSADGASWALLYRSDKAVSDGLLVEFNTRTVPRGGYLLRLLAVDRTGNYGPPCTVRITVE
jgi:hypothetical protein